MRRAAKRDLTEPVIVLAFLQAGFSVSRISAPYLPDLLIGKGGVDRTVEVKTGSRKLKPGQADWAERWRGAKPLVLRNLEDAQRVIESWPR